MIRTKLPIVKHRKSEKNPNGCGRLSKYHPELALRAYRLSLLGLIDKEIAECLCIPYNTYLVYMRQREDFRNAILKGKTEADSKVSEALYQAAVGYTHPDTHIMMYKGRIVKTKIMKHYPPNTGAAIFWLKNRTKLLENPWTDAIRHEMTGKNGKEITLLELNNMDMSLFTTEELKLMQEMVRKLHASETLTRPANQQLPEQTYMPRVNNKYKD